MPSEIGIKTHKQYGVYSRAEAAKLLGFIRTLKKLSNSKRPWYNLQSYQLHCEINSTRIANQLKISGEEVRIEASILFWLFRCGVFFNVQPPVVLPHICKLKIEGKEHFFVATKAEYAQHRAAQSKGELHVTYTDHAKVNYLERVLEIDVAALMKDAPTDELLPLGESHGVRLEDGRVAVHYQGHVYLLHGGVCVSVLNEGMQVE